MTGEAIKNLLQRVAIRVFFTLLHVSTATNNICSRSPAAERWYSKMDSNAALATAAKKDMTHKDRIYEYQKCSEKNGQLKTYTL